MMNCDAETGVCSLPELSDAHTVQAQSALELPVVRYIGDPMCSWCWGMSPALKEVASYCQSNGMVFSVHVGGLRPGGGDEWNASFKAFLRHEWGNIQRVTGQPFGFSVLDEATFNYDTEPACRAVVAMSLLLNNSPQVLLAFFSGIQRRFYVDGADPKQPAFYRELCVEASVSFDEFLRVFQSPEAKLATIEEFQRCRSWGVRGFPSIVLDVNGQISHLASGYTTSAALIEKLNLAITKTAMSS
jgi:putative protein-disulfide isomerase